MPIRPLLLACTLMVVLLGAACKPEGRIDKSPLATWDASRSDGVDLATVGRGTLDISAGCVRLILDNQKTILLVWPEPTSWDAASQTIEYVGVLGERMQLRDGDRIMPGGSGPFRGAQYVSPPSPSCRGMESFTLQSIRLVTD